MRTSSSTSVRRTGSEKGRKSRGETQGGATLGISPSFSKVDHAGLHRRPRSPLTDRDAQIANLRGQDFRKDDGPEEPEERGDSRSPLKLVLGRVLGDGTNDDEDSSSMSGTASVVDPRYATH